MYYIITCTIEPCHYIAPLTTLCTSYMYCTISGLLLVYLVHIALNILVYTFMWSVFCVSVCLSVCLSVGSGDCEYLAL